MNPLKLFTIGALAAASINTMQGATMVLDDTVGDSTSTPAGSGPWLTVTTAYTPVMVGAIPINAVTVTLKSNLQNQYEFFDKVGFVWSDGVDVSTLQIGSLIGLPAGNSIKDPSNSIIFERDNTIKVGLLWNFEETFELFRFNETDTVKFIVRNTDNTNLFTPDGVVARVNGRSHYSEPPALITTNNVPEPSAALLALIGLLPIFNRKRK